MIRLLALLLVSYCGLSLGYEYETKTINMRVDQFDHRNNDMYSMRYLQNDKYYDGKGPVFFYCGNEGSIEDFASMTGYMWEIAPEFNALIIFAEHRYYGHSMPYGSHAFDSRETVAYLTGDQAMADFIDLIQYLKSSIPGVDTAPMIAFGGSYGGMLAAWARMKYPHIIDGALAASAPIYEFVNGYFPCNSYSKITTDDLRSENEQCPLLIRKSWGYVDDLASTSSGLHSLSTIFRTCSPVQSGWGVKSFISGSVGGAGQHDFPYARGDVPGWPIAKMCERMTDSTGTPEQVLEQVARGMEIWYNYTGKYPCLDIYTITADIEAGRVGTRAPPRNKYRQAPAYRFGWGFQTCSDYLMPFCTDGVTDMFEPDPFDLESYKAQCRQNWYGVEPIIDLPTIRYGDKGQIGAATNIIFSNGLRDPWYGGGQLETLSETVVAILIPEGTHHLDLHASHPEDPQSVIDARLQEKTIIQGWVNDAQKRRRG